MAATHVEPFATNPCFPDPPSSSALKEVCRAPYHETVNANDGSGGGATSGWAPQSVLRFALSSARSRLFEASTEAAIRGWLQAYLMLLRFRGSTLLFCASQVHRCGRNGAGMTWEAWVTAEVKAQQYRCAFRALSFP